MFEEWFALNTTSTESFIFVAWNGETCDLCWIWHHLQAPQIELNFPSAIKYPLDLFKVIWHYKSCDLNPSK